MLIKANKVSRRRILRGMLSGAAVSVSMPFLEMFLNDSGTALADTGQPLPLRFGTWFWGLGIDPGAFIPKTLGADFELTEELKPIEKVKQHVNVYSNYDVITDGKPNLCHYTGWVALRTGSVPSGKNDLPGQSLDVTIADVIGNGTRFRSLEMAATGGPRDSYSFLSADAINPPAISAVDLYRTIFGPDFQDPNSPDFKPSPAIMLRKSVLSGISEQRKDFERGLSAADKARLDQYYTSIREIENRLTLQLEKPPEAPTCKIPTEPKEIPVGLEVGQVASRHRAMTDLLAMALACNQTKVFNMVYSDSSSSLTLRGLDKTHHTVTHEEAVDAEKGYQLTSARFVAEALKEWSYFVEKLASTPEGAGSVLDRCLVYAHSDCQVAKVHSISGIPMMTAGSLGGKIKTGLHLDGKREAATRLGFTLQRVLGVPIGSWGSGSMTATQDISEILT
jgi:Protein of unknown function (DUF1552)